MGIFCTIELWTHRVLLPHSVFSIAFKCNYSGNKLALRENFDEIKGSLSSIKFMGHGNLHSMTGKPGQKTSRFGEKGMRLVRSWETLLLLVESPAPLTALEIHEKIHSELPFSDKECSVQTTREDLRTLQKCGFPVCMVNEQGNEIEAGEMESSQGRLKNVKWHIRDPKNLGELRHSYHRLPTTSDLLTLSLCRALLKNMVPKQYPLYRSLLKILEELQLQINKALRVDDPRIADLHGKVQILGRRFVGKSVSSEAWSIMTTAIARRHVLLATYKNRAGEMRQVDIAPLAVWFSDGRAYVLAAGATDEKVRAWRIDKFADISVDLSRKGPEVSDEIIENTLKKSFKGYISNPAIISLKVKPDAAYLFREFQYHPSQQFIELPDGCLEVTMETTMSWGLEEWILSLGELIVVKEPEELRQRIKSRLKAGLSEYH
jgi:predicted DNA-binding transcriptional regulator YafY